MISFSFQDLGLKPKTVKAVARKAKGLGQSPPEFVRELIEREVLADEPFDRMLGKVREDVRKKGVSEAELDAIVERARKNGERRPRGRR